MKERETKIIKSQESINFFVNIKECRFKSLVFLIIFEIEKQKIPQNNPFMLVIMLLLHRVSHET